MVFSDWYNQSINIKIEDGCGTVPGSPMVKTPTSSARARVQSLVRELRSYTLRGMTKKTFKRKR